MNAVPQTQNQMTQLAPNQNSPQPVAWCIHELFSAHADRIPDSIAIVFGDQQLTYGELNRRANQLAQYLKKLGVGPEVVVGLCVERSLEMIVGLLGILKAGGAYLPLDPAYPAERLEFTLQDAKAGLLLTQEALREKLGPHDARVIALDTDWPAIARESDQNPMGACTSANLAYIIYTSGSTGRPKGVCVTHASVVHLIESCRPVFNFGVDDVWTVVHSYAFDLSVWEIFGALLTGGRLIIVPLLVTQSPADFYRLLCDGKVTVLNQTPSAARQLYDVVQKFFPQKELSLRLFICGGEALPADLAAELLTWEIPFWNFYGPTESTVWASITKVEREDLGTGSVTIGNAIRDLETYILDDDMTPVTQGSAGELCLGGPQLARGYFNRADLTAEKFIPHNLGSDPGARLYKTGDLARCLPNGKLEHLGRLDHQVKVRGFRIELEEIETVIAQHPLVREAVVTADEGDPGEKRLVAYVVTKTRESVSDTGSVLEEHRLADWRTIWDETYRQVPTPGDPTFNITGWNSSYTGLPYSVEEMAEWVDQTVERIRELRPRRVLEIGCGSGLLLFRLAPTCEYYVGADPSEPAQAFLQKQLAGRGPQLAQVALSQRMADDFEGFEPESFDTVIINSVAQYFPRVEYLLRVLEGAVSVTKPGGTIFIGDLRNLKLANTFHTSVQVSQAPQYLPLIDLRRRVRKNILQDEQLAIDPSFFEALQKHLPRLSQVEVQLKRGSAQNETTKFRYDVVLRVGAQPVRGLKPTTLDWQAQELRLPDVSRVLLAEGDKSLTITNVPNARVYADVKLAELLATEDFETVSDLRAGLREIANVGVDPEDWRRMAAEANLAVRVTWSASGKLECYDVTIAHPMHTTLDDASRQIFSSTQATVDWTVYANDPLQGSFVRRLAPQLRSFLRESLPEYMVPSTFVLLETLPLTPNAKIDRAALPAPDVARPELDEAFVPPGNQTEADLAEIWASVLKLDRVGIRDNFMELGGHSVLATQIISRARDVFQVELPLRTIFEAPTVAAMSATIEVAQQGKTRPISTPRPVARGEMVPLSFAQQRLWFLDQLVPGTPVYNLPAGVRLPYAIDVGALHKSLNEIVRRHETLRTTIGVRDGQPHQIIAPTLELDLPLFDLRSLPKTERKNEMRRLVREDAERLFDLGRGPLLRTALIQLADEDFLLSVTMHHIVSDNWSIILFFEELSNLYDAFSSGLSSSLAPLPIQYADYAAWQRDELSNNVLEEQLTYWRRRLAGAPTTLELPTDRPRPAIVGFRGQRRSLTLSKSLTQSLRLLGQRAGATTFMTLLAVFNVLLHRLSGQDDILVGSPIANRVRTETEGLIGLFLNNLVLRTKLSAETSWRDLLEQVRETALGAYAHQDLPFEKLVEELQQQRDLSRTPLFQVFLNLFDSADNEIEFGGYKAEVSSPIEAWSQFDLTLYAAEHNETIELTLAFSTDLFAAARTVEMLEQFRYLLQQMVAEPDKQIGQYSLLTPPSRLYLPDPATVLDEPDQEPITKTFMARAKESPEHPALRQGARTWTYRDLERQADFIAHELLSGGLAQGDVVAVSGPRSFELIASLIGVLKSGGVLLMLDRNLPGERQKLMLTEARAQRLLYVGDWQPDDLWLREIPFLIVREVQENAGESWQVISSDLPEPGPSDPAYLFFTSGTTGVPKGVLGCHKGLAHFLKWQREQFEITPADRCAQLTGLSFDVVLRDIFLPLTSGATLHLPDGSTEASAAHILEWLERDRISILHTVPTLAQAWLSEVASPVSLESLRWVFFAGEPLTDSLVRQWRNSFPGPGSLANFYGPTETTLAKCFYVVPEEPEAGVQPVGRALPNTQALVLNANKACGIGEPGEIVIRTPFRTLGYINAAAEQSARFFKNPFTGEENDLLYRTGDRGRYRPDGLLEILGRLDQQIKIRGVRVEPAEVNAVLARHPSVAASVVVSTVEQGENALVAYVVPGPEGFEVRQLREYLELHLPAAMVPTYFVPLEELPLTANGKVDRSALPLPDHSFVNAKQEFVAPRDVTEELIAGVWSEVLGLKEIGVRDSFFELGGHSLRAMQVLSRINGIFKIELPLTALFAHVTVERLAAVIEDHLVDQLNAMTEDEAHHLFG
ncbi:MAG: amino acid adenylation domain protein [Acidobacteria bacterium]|nr:amino acid adenylation domain protein [Acidobacteriota bacterium]